MSADITWTLAGIDTRRWLIQAGSLWRPAVAVRRSVLTVPNRHGVTRTPRPPVFEEPVVSLEMRCRGVMSSLEATYNELQSLLTSPGLVLGRTSGGITTSSPVEFVTATPGQFIADTLADISVQLAVPGVFFRAASVDSAPEGVTTGEVVSLPGLAVSTGPVGDAVLRFRGAATSVSIVDVVSGTGISWTGALTGSQFLFLHPATATARIATASDWSTGGTDVSGGLSYPAPGLLQIWPRMAVADPAVRAASVTVTGAGFDGTAALTVRAQPAYL
jgi:hypothetical protein